MDETFAAKVHWLAFTAYWYLLYFLWKVVICLLYVIGIDDHQYNTLLTCKLLIIIGIWSYTIVALYLFYFIYIKNNGKNPYFFRHPVKNLSFFMPIINPNISQSETKYTFAKYLLLFIGITMVLITIILEFNNIKMNLTICFIPIFISIIMHQICTYDNESNMHFITTIISYSFSTFIAFTLVWILICIILQNDANINFNSLYITIPIIILSIYFDILFDLTLISQTEMVYLSALLCVCLPAILMICSWITFIILFIIYFVNANVFTMAIVFIPIWIIFAFEACHLCLGVASASTNPKEFILTHEYGKHIMVSTFNDSNTLNKLNKALQYKRDTEIGKNKMIDLSPIMVKQNNNIQDNNIQKGHGYDSDNSGDSLMVNKVFYRLRCKDIVADIISPNHVCLDNKAYKFYTRGDAYTQQILDILLKNEPEPSRDRMVQYVNSTIKVDNSCFYQWIPTEFQVRFKDNVNCLEWKDMKTEYIDVKLNSLYIADVNQFRYENLNEIIINILKTKIISLFIHSIVGCCVSKESNEYKQLLFEWCSTNKILNIIVKCQQYEFGDNTEWDYNISGDYHIDGTLQEKVSHIAILYADIDDSIRGGDLNLAFDSFLGNVWKFKPKKSSIIVFPNMYHKIDEISIWKWNTCIRKPLKVKQKRRILSFFLCSNEYFPSSAAYNALCFNDRYGMSDLQNNVNETSKMLLELPLLTTNDLFPFDKEHCNVLLIDVLSKLWKDVPDTIIVIITEYIIDNALLRNESEMEMNARCLREYRRHFVKFQEAHRPMVCD
eukprot:531782_1